MSLIEQAVLSGRPVVTNIELTRRCPYYDRVALIDTEEFPIYRGKPALHGKPASSDYLAFWHYVPNGAVVIIDEADSYFDCSDHSAMGHDIRQFFKGLRKLDMDIVCIVQKLPNLYVRIRRVAERFTVCEWTWRSMRILQRMAAWIGVERAMRLSRFIRSEFSDEPFCEFTHLADGYISYQEAVRFFDWYGTKQLVGDLARIRSLHGVLDGNSESSPGST
jgi:hypothetical protein